MNLLMSSTNIILLQLQSADNRFYQMVDSILWKQNKNKRTAINLFILATHGQLNIGKKK